MELFDAPLSNKSLTCERKQTIEMTTIDIFSIARN